MLVLAARAPACRPLLSRAACIVMTGGTGQTAQPASVSCLIRGIGILSMYMSGSALLQVLVKEGDHVKKGQSLVVLEAMKVLPLCAIISSQILHHALHPIESCSVTPFLVTPFWSKTYLPSELAHALER